MTPTLRIANGMALGRVSSGVSISSAALAIDSKPVNAYNAATVASVKLATVLFPISAAPNNEYDAGWYADHDVA